jgi:hypothetical protein
MIDVRDRRLLRRPVPAALGPARFVMTRDPSGRSGQYENFVGGESVTGATRYVVTQLDDWIHGSVPSDHWDTASRRRIVCLANHIECR